MSSFQLIGKFRITTNGLWFRVEYATHLNWSTETYERWVNVSTVECYSNIPARFNTINEAHQVCEFLSLGGDPFTFKPVHLVEHTHR